MRKIINIKIYIFFLLLIVSCDTRYNTLDIDSINQSSYPAPVVVVSNGSFKSCIEIVIESGIKIDGALLYRSDSINGEYNLIKTFGEFDSLKYYDINEIIPQKKYYYKAKAYYLSSKLSDYSEIASGYRAGSIEDSFENDNTTDLSKDLSLDEVTGLHSIYPEGDIDFFKFDGEENNYYSINILSTGNVYSDISYYTITVYDASLNIIKIGYSNNNNNNKNCFFSTNNTQYFVSVSSAYTGDYKLQITLDNEPPEKVINLFDGTLSSDFVEKKWKSANRAERYFVYRSESYQGDYIQIKIYQDKYVDESSDFTYSTKFFDRDNEPGKMYYYRVKSSNRFGDGEISDIFSGYRFLLEKDIYESDDVTSDAKNIFIGESYLQDRTIHSANDIDWVVFEAKMGYSYNILKINGTYINCEVDIELYDSKFNILTKNENLSINNWFCGESGLYYIKIYNRYLFSGDYSIKINYNFNN